MGRCAGIYPAPVRIAGIRHEIIQIHNFEAQIHRAAVHKERR